MLTPNQIVNELWIYSRDLLKKGDERLREAVISIYYDFQTSF
jgi:hypothetical protein